MLLSSYIPLLLTSVLLTLPMVLSRDVHETSNGAVCTSPCAKDGTHYYWCKLQSHGSSDWDYCSPQEGYDYENRLCESPCQTKGYTDQWCKTGLFSWGYCGHITEEFEILNTVYGEPCVDNCALKGDFFQCYIKTGSNDYCSPSNDVTIKGEPCLKDHPCGLHDKTYNWCYTEKHLLKWDWDYCGKIISDCDKPIHLPHRRKRQPQGQEEEICRINDSGNRRITVLTAVGEPRLTRPSREQFMEASRVINMINANTCFGCASGTIFSTNTIRLDLQGTFVRNGVRYINIQLQINGPRHGQSSIAQVIFPQDLDIKNYYRYIRRALQISMRGAYHGDPVKVTITIERYR
ncbi:hypothetical protein FKM82_021235 [Ascaphus truei]